MTISSLRAGSAVPLSDHVYAAELATAAGRLLVDLRGSGPQGADLKALGDRESHLFLTEELARLFLTEELARHRPEDGVLSEEGDHHTDRLTRQRVWVIDPLDGTREYSEPPRDDWAVHVALVVGGVAVAGAVALPGRCVTLHTGEPVVRSSSVPTMPRLAVSRTRPTEHALLIAQTLDAELVAMGSAGAKAMAVVLGEADVYAHSGGQYEWDSAAPVAVAAAAGLHVSRLDGSPLVYNQANPWLPDLLICVPELAHAVIDCCAQG